ncbi:MAG: type II secretion system F family protein [Betaproteobacteria bacterium]|jgi:general secretion pathway protein F|nr:MAG: type II secretion system F family protein [Betaproteobacteria bacterium]
MRYEVKAVKGGGMVVSLSMEARDDRDAADQARSRGMNVLAVRRIGALSVPVFKRRSARFPIVLFSQELLALLRSGISLVEALETLAERESGGSSGQVISGLIAKLREGQSFSKALQGFPESFPELYVATVRASERTGSLVEALTRFVTYQTQLDSVKKHLVSASIYPVILILVGGLVSLFLLGYVVPRFSHIYEDIGGDLPMLTRALMVWGRFVEEHGALLLGGMSAAVLGLVTWLRQPMARRLIARQVMRIPAIGEHVRVYQLTRFYRTMGMLLSGGTPVAQAIGMVSGLLDDELRRRLDGALLRVNEGKPLSASLEAQSLTTPVALRMLRVGERTGQMGDMMERIAAFHEEELGRWVERFTRTFEPLLMAVIGIVIGGIVLLMYFPIFELAGSMT